MGLEELLAQAIASPSLIKPCDGGSLLSLALHCLMVEHGFVALDSDGRAQLSPGNLFRPPACWNGRQNEWIFKYARRGAANRFRLHVACLPASGRVFVHGSELKWDDEAPLEGKIAILGLQLENYVPEPAAAAASQPGWQGVISNQDKLQQLFLEHVMVPLSQRAEALLAGPYSLPPAAASRWPLGVGDVAAWARDGACHLGQRAQRGASQWGQALQRQQAGALLGAGIAAAAVGMAVVVLRARATA